MSFLALSAAASFLLALLLGASAVLAPAAALHVAFAMGVLPLIFGAMLHFVPVLTRTGTPHRLIGMLPMLAQAVGLLVVLAIQGLLPRWLLHPAASVDLLLAAILLGWLAHRARRTLGTPHPGWRWYAAALSVLVLALAAVPPLVAGQASAALRLFHVHANTLGFVGLAALGTLPVLMPTILGRADAQAAPWLRRRLPVALAGVLLLAVGAATMWPLAVVGGAFLVVVALGLLVHWIKSFGLKALLVDGASAPLTAALCGYVLLLLFGAAHAAGVGGVGGVGGTAGIIPAFAAGFLLPLVTGALTQLLPVWRFAGPQTPARHEMRRRLARTGRLRALILSIASVAFLLDQEGVGAIGIAIGLGLFFADLFRALRVPPPAR
ncbi:MAG: hypothetical protein QG616_1536 [Pseudomonadota bacterium]|nr:hypothetical protein [Pseudomonadota bacterium]MDQ5881705.1 hypothetical protein [Pseudomonadota bacterium]MDQ5905348.1 hypothetical protein [Pseudomonadota bacterium]MDQ5907568.1 hypothetical protein [Pseudomonadota bacterium]MDQ5918816.1 hypothetical protein [Pseudomonadota bacterium]